MKKLVSLSRLVLFALAVSQLLSNCTADSFKPVQNDQASMGADQAYAAQQPASALPRDDGAVVRTTTPVAAAQSARPTMVANDDNTTDYRISAQDILQVAVFQIKDLDSAVQVGEDGNIALPLVGKIPVKGKTTYEAEQMIAGKLREKYLQSPQVTVSIKQYGRRITISGEVKTPRVLPDDGNTTLSQAIAGSGGVSELADPARIHVARSRDQRVQDEIYDLSEIQAGKAKDPLLRGGDIVVVETSGTRVALKNVKDLLPFAMLAAVF
jgi:polysaccharide biosynthesis/export protein